MPAEGLRTRMRFAGGHMKISSGVCLGACSSHHWMGCWTPLDVLPQNDSHFAFLTEQTSRECRQSSPAHPPIKRVRTLILMTSCKIPLLGKAFLLSRDWVWSPRCTLPPAMPLHLNLIQCALVGHGHVPGAVLSTGQDRHWEPSLAGTRKVIHPGHHKKGTWGVF